MNKTIGLIVSASVIMMAALVVIFMTGGSLSQTDNNLEDSEEQSVCEFQVERAEEEGSWDRVDERCLDDSYVSGDAEEDAVAEAVESDIT